MSLGEYTTFIQWKGTDLCMDFNCPKCKEYTHFDGMFAYSIECSGCKTRYKMPDEIGTLLVELPKDTDEMVLKGIYEDE